ncbi:nitroreductase family protein [Kineosporia succinea]|uniref:Nitroreductase n=1 Tax=Kineosporia succinea TaxID=84632 RepID=A0ABT9PCS3_9ACTN|nr:nitroreductase family protein [Kineosporia succinea]MDP9830518.1 nitroreductase [Kineosporia succinea]
MTSTTPSSTVTEKAATTAVPLNDLLAHRWSSRAFDPQHELSEPQVSALLEAARWAPSASNTQPWRFVVARRGTAEFDAVLDTLAGGNQVWARHASALLVVAAQGTDRPWALYDTGQSVALLSVQAGHEGLAAHQMGGFDRERLQAALPDGVTPLVVVALVRRSEHTRLPEPFAGRETAGRERLPLEQLMLSLRLPTAS